MVGQLVKFSLGRSYSAQDAMDMGMVNAVIPHAELEDTAYEAQEILGNHLWL
jgi:naphthoate synthase